MSHILPYIGFVLAGGAGIVAFLWWLSGWRNIGPNEIGYLQKNWGGKSLASGEVIALNGERGYQARILTPGWQWIPTIIYTVHKEPVIQIGSDELGLVVSQVGAPPPVGARTAQYKTEFGDFQDLEAFMRNGGQKGKQRWVLRTGTYRIHPAAFLVLTPNHIFGRPMDPDLQALADKGQLKLDHFNLNPEDLRPTVVRPKQTGADELERNMDANVDPRRAAPSSSGLRDRLVNMMGVLTSQEGPPLEDGQLACRLSGYADIEAETDPKKRINLILANSNSAHQAYQNYEAFLTQGGKAGLQHDPVTEGTYYYNPWLVSVEKLPVLHVLEGEVAVIKSKVGLVEQDISGQEFKFGSIVLPGHRGLWSEPIRTGSWLLNPRCYEASIVPTKILTLYWADQLNAAGKLDEKLKTIKAKSKDGFDFSVELQVQIHISDTNAPRVISMVGSVQNLVNEVLQSAVGNYFRNKIQSMSATDFIQKRDEVQQAAFKYIEENLQQYEVVTLGVFLQDIQFPPELADVLKQREIAAQEVETFDRKRVAQETRLETEKAKGRADQQADLAKSEIAIVIEANNASARMKKADGESYFTEKTGAGMAASILAKGTAEATVSEKKQLALANGLEAQKNAVGEQATLLVNVIRAISDGHVKITPDVMVSGTGSDGASNGILALLMAQMAGAVKTAPTAVTSEPKADAAAPEDTSEQK